MDYSKLRGKIREVYHSEFEFAKAMNLSRTTLSAKLNGKTQWSMSEVENSCKLLTIPMSEIEIYFFTTRV